MCRKFMSYNETNFTEENLKDIFFEEVSFDYLSYIINIAKISSKICI